MSQTQQQQWEVFRHMKNVDIQHNNHKNDRVFGRDITNMTQQHKLNIQNEITKKKNFGGHNISTHTQQELIRIAQEDQSNPQLVSDYQQQIFEYLRQEESKYLISDYMVNQPDINDKMREILIDWLVDVHKVFKMVPETLFLAVYLIDKYLDSHKVQRQNLQLLGATASFIASKYEVIYPPQLKDFVEVCDRTYTKQQILDMESDIMRTLNFNITVPSSLRYIKLMTGDERVYNLGRYLLELSLVQYSFTKYSPSNIAISCIYLALKIFQKTECWSETIGEHSKYEEQDIRGCSKDLCVMLQNINNTKLQAVKRKFSTSQYLEISNIQLQKVQ